MIQLNHLIKEHLVYEGLIRSVSKSTFEYMINRWLISSDKIQIVKETNDVKKLELIFNQNLNEDELVNLTKYINTLGWFVSAYYVIEKMKWKPFHMNYFLKNEMNNHIHSFQVEAKFDTEVTDKGFKVLYHTTPSINDEKIQKIGLVPKGISKISYHPERIYFSINKNDLEFISKKFHQRDKSLTEFSFYEIYIDKERKRNEELRLFQDPNFGNGLYTLSNIHKDNLKFLKKIKL